jgi:hypothetical protein
MLHGLAHFLEWRRGAAGEASRVGEMQARADSTVCCTKKKFPRASEDAAKQGREKGQVRCGTTLLYWPNRGKNGGSPGGFPMKNFVDLKTPMDQEEEGKRRGKGGE